MTTIRSRMQWPASAAAVVRTWRFAYAQTGVRVLWGLGASTTGLYVAATAWLSKSVVDALAGLPGPEGTRRALGFAAIYALATVLHAGIGALYCIRLLAIRDRLVSAADQRLMRAVADVEGVASFDVPETRDRIRLASAGARALPACLTASIDVAQHLVTLVGVSLILGHYHPVLVLLVLLPPIPLFRAQMRVSAHTFAVLAGQSNAYRRMRYVVDLMLGAQAAKEVRVYRTGRFLLDQYERTADAVFAVSRAHRRRAGSATIGRGLLAALGVGGAYVYVVHLAAQGLLTVGDVVMYTSTVFYGGAAIRGGIQAASTLTADGLAARAFYDFVDTERAREHQEPRPKPPASAAHGVPEWQLRSVRFTYAGQERPAVDGVTLTIDPGETVAIVGFNGAGKTTLMKLMLRLLEPQCGEILFRGRPLEEWDVDAFRQTCGVVFQDFAKFKLTLHENLAVGDAACDGPARDARLLRAAAIAGADEIAAGAPHGYATQLGTEFHQGIELSEGQWSRVALARALVRDSTLLWLDEPSASLDPRMEQAALERILSCARHQTTIVISHRLAITAAVDRIVVLDGGRVIEEGSHTELMARVGAYADMYRTQSSMYWPAAR